MNKNKIQIKNIFIFFIVAFFIFFQFNFAGALVPGSAERTVQYKEGSYQLVDVLLVGRNVFDWVLGIIGSLALLFFVFGGFMFLISSGNEQKVAEAKAIITNAVIGILIVFGSYIAIEFFMEAIGYQPQLN